LLAVIYELLSAQKIYTYDIVIYGGTSAGVVAAVQATRMNKSVVIIEPGTKQQLGGLSSGGLGKTDFGNKQVVGGISREFYKQLKSYYSEEKVWIWQKRDNFFDPEQNKVSANPEDDAMWYFEPSAARKIFQDWIDIYKIPVVYGERLNRKGEAHTKQQADGWCVALNGKVSNGVVKDKNGKITEIIMESGLRFCGKYFIDATYEGDLMAGAGISFTVGREGFNIYREDLNGVRSKISAPDDGTPPWHHHQFVDGVDPYKVPGQPASGTLPFIDPKGPEVEGSSDHRIQAYCFRMCLTDHPDNRIPFKKPEGYKEEDYELLIRNYEAGFDRLPWINSSMPNRKTDTNNQSGFSTDFIGENYDYPEGSYSERQKIVVRHKSYQQGLMWTLANHPRIPEKIRSQISKWGMTKDEFVEGEGWQDQLYIREARRMISSVVMTQHHCQGSEVAKKSVGMGAYGMDSHHTQRYIDSSKFVRNEGDVQVRVKSPYPVDYESIIPKASECTNLVVPVALSASHISYGSIRMEPIFMVLGQSGATAACLAIDAGNISLQNVNYKNLKEKLLLDGQVLQTDNINQ
jgi:hypothetical protein